LVLKDPKTIKILLKNLNKFDLDLKECFVIKPRMEGTKNTMNEIIDELVKNVNTLKQTHDDEFCGEGVNITDELPSMDEALKLRQTMEKIKEIYEWSDDLDDENIFLDVIRNREEIYDKYYDQPDIKEKYESLKEENEKLKEEVEVSGGVYTDFKNMKDERDGLKVRWEELKEENENLKKQIPQKPGKKLSQNDKELLEKVWEVADIGDTNIIKTKKLMKRLLK
tara:strand:+ start:361 stop:1032 length:672 start_codon:yes stop_codon:yes gene_type:complete